MITVFFIILHNKRAKGVILTMSSHAFTPQNIFLYFCIRKWLLHNTITLKLLVANVFFRVCTNNTDPKQTKKMKNRLHINNPRWRDLSFSGQKYIPINFELTCRRFSMWKDYCWKSSSSTTKTRATRTILIICLMRYMHGYEYRINGELFIKLNGCNARGECKT